MNNDDLEMHRMMRLINPPVVIRRQCRLCGKPMESMDLDQMMLQHGTDLFAHMDCYERERPDWRNRASERRRSDGTL